MFNNDADLGVLILLAFVILPIIGYPFICFCQFFFSIFSRIIYFFIYQKELNSFSNALSILLSERKLNEKLTDFELEGNPFKNIIFLFKRTVYFEDTNIQLMNTFNSNKKIDEKEKNIIIEKINIMNSIIDKKNVNKVELLAVKDQSKKLRNELLEGFYFSKIGYQPDEYMGNIINNLESFLSNKNLKQLEKYSSNYLNKLLNLEPKKIKRYVGSTILNDIRKLIEYRELKLNENKEIPILESLYEKLDVFSFITLKNIEKEEEDRELKKEVSEKQKEEELYEKITNKIDSVK